MKLLFDFFPVLAFFAAFKLYDIYVATAVSIAAAFVQVGLFWLRTRRFERLHIITLVSLVLLGGLTLALHDDVFIKWKPTIVNWVLAGLVLGSQFLGKKTVMERLLGGQLELPPTVWQRVNLSWGFFFLVVGGLNVYVAFFYGADLDAAARQAAWVNFKVFGLLGLTLAFGLAQALFLARHIAPEKDG